MNATWQPTASIDVLRKRAAIIHGIRDFFNARELLEVETPSLSRHTITDPYLHALKTLHCEPGSNNVNTLYLQTSPEFAMKRLLAAGSGDIYQISKAYRNDEVGRLHNPEFTLLEWYRLGFDMQALIDETTDLLKLVLQLNEIEQYTYSELFNIHCGFDPIIIQTEDLIKQCKIYRLAEYAESLKQHLDLQQSSDELVKDSLLQVIFNQEIETKIGQHTPCVVSHFPASQASLATLTQCKRFAKRFEVYYQGIELANGFEELNDAEIQLRRFEDDNLKRKSLGLAAQKVDALFIESLRHGLPHCAGIALGIDRLIMLALGKNSIKEVLSFNLYNC